MFMTWQLLSKYINFHFRMVLLINGVPLEEAPRDIPSFFQQFPHFKEQASNICSTKTQVVGPVGLLYVFQREFAVTHPHDNKISTLGTDDVTTGHILIIRHTGKFHLNKENNDLTYT